MSINMLFENEIMIEGHPIYKCDNNSKINMGARIPSHKKQAMIPFINRNLGKMSQREIARRLSVGKTSINRWSGELGFRFIKPTVNENYFDILNEEVAYILGYIFADGNISWNPKKGYQALTITASEKDYPHLEMVRKKLSSTKQLIYSNKTNSYRLIINNKRICSKLMKLGVIPKKSLIVKFPAISKKYVRHFIRGVVDGDGTVRYVKRKRSPYFEILISSGSKEFIMKLAESINESIGVSAKLRMVGRNTFLLQYSCTRGMKLAQWLYKDEDSNLFLHRKFNNYKIALRAKGGGDVP